MSHISSVYKFLRVEIMSKDAIPTRWSVFGIVLAAIFRTALNKLWHFVFFHLISWFWIKAIKKISDIWILVAIKLPSAEVKNSEVILWIVLPILTNSFSKTKFVECFGKKWLNNPQNSSATFHFCHSAYR